MEPGKPVHGMDGRRFERKRRRRGRKGRPAVARGGLSVRACLYLLPETGREDARRRTRQAGSGLGAGFEELAAQREALRLFAGTQQKGNGREIRRRAGAHLAPQLRRGSGAARRRGPAQPALRSPLPRRTRSGVAPHRVAARHRRPHHALLDAKSCLRSPATTPCWSWPTATACAASSNT